MRTGQILMPEFIQMIRDTGVVPSVILDVGAYDGEDTRALKRAFPSARCIAVEGDPYNFALLLQTDIEAVCEVITAAPGPAEWRRSSTAPKISGLRDRGLNDPPVRCEATNLFTLCRRLGTPRVDVMKIDVEGMTYEALIGMGPFLKHVRMLHIETEDYPYFAGQRLHAEVCELMSGYAFQCLAISGVSDGQQGTQYDSVWG